MAEEIRVLHVDDEPEFADLTATYLEREDDRLTVETATSGADGLDRLTEDIDCVISDYEMPGMDGISFLEAVRERYPNLPFILFTGKGSEAVASEAISAGVTDYLQKTTGTEQYELLCKRIENAVGRRRAQTNYRELLEKTPVGLTTHDPETGVILDANQTFGDLLGYEPDELEGRHLGELSPDDSPFDRETANRLIQETIETGHQQFELQDRTKDGNVVWVDITCKRATIDGHQRVVAIAREITEQKKREQELERYANIVEASGDPVYTLDGQGRFTFVNDALLEMTGYDEADLLGNHFSSILVREDAERGGMVMRSLRVTDTDRRTTELTVVRPDGGRVPCEIKVTPLPYDTEFRGIVGVIRDITERKERERELQRERDRYQSLFESTNDAVVWTEFEGETPIIREANPRFRELFEPPGEDVHGQSLNEVVTDETHPERRAQARAISRRVKGGAHESGEFQRDTVDGPRTFIWEAFPHTPPGADEVQNSHIIYTDITERKERERQVRRHREQLERREEKLIRLRDYTQELMYAETPAETATIALGAVDEILGFDLGAVFTQSETQEGVLEVVEVLNRARMEKMYGGLPAFLRDAPAGTHSALAWEVFETGESVFINDTAESERLARKSPFGSLMIYPIGQHGIVLLAATRMDAFTETEEILLDLLAAALETSFDRLEREQDLLRQRDELRRQNERLDKFVSVVSHDLRNPLNVATARLELARDDCDSVHLEEVGGALDRMSTLIEDLLALAREGEPSSDLEPVALADLAETCWETVATRDASLVVDTDGVVRADRSRLQQLLENLIRNAIEHGGSEVTITIGDDGDGFYVADDGPGIGETEREKVFETGYSTTEDNTGFGLNIVREIVEAHGWEIGVVDSADGGARFEITDLEVVK